MCKMDINAFKQVLIDCVIERVEIQELFNRIYKVVKLPLLCFDVSFKTLAFAFEQPFYYLPWEELASNGFVSDETVFLRNYLESQEKIYSTGKSALYNSGTSLGFPQVCGPVICDNQLVAYCGIMIEDQFYQDVIFINDMIASVIAVLLKNNLVGGALPNFSHDELILLQNKIPSDFHNNFAPPYILTVLASTGAGVSTLKYVNRQLKSSCEKIISCTSEDNYIYTLYTGVENKDDLQKIIDKLHAIVGRHLLIAGISDFFYDMNDLKTRNMQAMLSISTGKIKKSSDKIFQFREIYIDILEFCAIESLGETACTLEEINLLCLEDNSSNSDYISTLHHYMKNLRRPSTTSKALNLHKNTVLNRLSKIREIICNDLDNENCANRLYLGLEIHEKIKFIEELRRNQ